MNFNFSHNLDTELETQFFSMLSRLKYGRLPSRGYRRPDLDARPRDRTEDADARTAETRNFFPGACIDILSLDVVQNMTTNWKLGIQTLVLTGVYEVSTCF